MDDAVLWGRLDVVVWLHENRTEGCTTKAMDHVLDRLYDPEVVEVAEWLLVHRQEGFTRKAIDLVIKCRNAKAIRFLLKNYLDQLTVHDIARLTVSFLGTLMSLPATHRLKIHIKCLEAMTDAYASIADPSAPPLDETAAKLPDIDFVPW
ncbi:hypothetical protein BC831DRAFT_458708 [Entophlyctis helioformis]|nr:hypothetical protein BC831DRAFT_462638 [Entophlyctis helioformis]KAI8926017.1 hypothetical protein BC831DRAFT_458708 [Entophlyctis helioformis]